MKNQHGFLMTLEAAFSLALLLIATSSLQAFRMQENPAPDFFLCSDAALALSRLHAFSGARLQETLDSMHELSGMCFSAQRVSSEGCAKSAFRGTLALQMPVFDGTALASAQVSCWRQ